MIYDQYLGQTLSLLNRIFVEAKDETAAIVYFHKYFAERALELGCPTLGLHFANLYAGRREILRSRGTDDPKRMLYTVIHEQFAIFHELGHELLNVDHSYIRFIKEYVSELLAHRRDNHAKGTITSVLANFKNADSAACHDKALEVLEAEVREHFDNDAGRSWRTAFQKQLDEPDTAVELFCDFVAVDCVLGGFDGAASLEDVLRALYVGSYHLKTLTYFDWHCLEILLHRTTHHDMTSRFSRNFLAFQVRNQCLREHLLFVYEVRLKEAGKESVPELVESLNQLLLLDQRRHYESIFDPAAKVLAFAGLDGKLDALASAVLKRFKDPQKLAMKDALANLAIFTNTGWPTSLMGGRFTAALARSVK
ncbi:hypothetical protein LB533_03480 [Mesorhizobium sp. BR1-1-13]|uniref:hypothetical protein n=1 Tax=Mesorhizobium sp. BR1-1-13 TaxID=2876656 RepID=UPI001CD164C9|nr:hypothetical protein [Mesorhizobium sp. BR1-1-13]MBZ9940161.1 hypothetical protein [Mesorhizobium sp. BR1-1-13]